MTDNAAAFQATIHGLRTVPSRGVVQVVVEAKIEELPSIARIAEHGAWVAVARLQEPKGGADEVANEPIPAHSPPRPQQQDKPAGGAKHWDDMSPAQQAGILCAEPAFAAFLRECYADAYNETAGPANEFERAAQCVRLICGVDSRAHIKPGTGAAASWMMIDADFRAWKLAPEVGA